MQRLALAFVIFVPFFKIQRSRQSSSEHQSVSNSGHLTTRTLSPPFLDTRKCGWVCPSVHSHLDDPHFCGLLPSPCCCRPEKRPSNQESFIGVAWSDAFTRSILTREEAFEILRVECFWLPLPQKNHIRHLKLQTPDGLAVAESVFKGDVNIYLGLSNSELMRIVEDSGHVNTIVMHVIKPYKHVIKVVILGNEPLICMRTENWRSRSECGPVNPALTLVRGIKILIAALKKADLKIPVTTCLNGGIITIKDPGTPCAARYKVHLQPWLNEVFQLVEEQGAPMMLNLYTWFAAMKDHTSAPMALGWTEQVTEIYNFHHRVEDNVGSYELKDNEFNYRFDIDVQLEAHRIAMCREGFQNLQIWLGESGWTTVGHGRATPGNARKYFESLAMVARGENPNNCRGHIRTSDWKIPIFLFEAFDESAKDVNHEGIMFEVGFGVFTNDGSPKWPKSDGLNDLGFLGWSDPLGSNGRATQEGAAGRSASVLTVAEAH